MNPHVYKMTFCKLRTCATRPFQISAFLAKPQGDRPSLKFQRRSANCVVVLPVFDTADSRATEDAEVVTKADADDRQDTTATRVNSTRFIIVICSRY